MSYYEELTGNLPDFAQGSAIIDQGVCRKACAEVDRLRAELALEKERKLDAVYRLKTLRLALAAAKDEAEKAKADTARLDWLQDVWDACEAADDVGPWERVYCASKVGASLSAAIDAARADAARKEQI